MQSETCAIDGSCCGPDSDCCVQGASVRMGREGDYDEIASLLKANKLPVDGVRENLKEFIVSEKNGQIIATAAIERYADAGLLRSVAVSDALKGQGLGASLVSKLLEQAKRDGIEDVFLLTTTAEKYFPRFGFDLVSRSDVPEALNRSEEFRGACPASAIVMRRRL